MPVRSMPRLETRVGMIVDASLTRYGNRFMVNQPQPVSDPRAEGLRQPILALSSGGVGHERDLA
jgi:hypothetical protein